MSASQEPERINMAAEWADKPAIYNIPPQEDMARYYANNLVKRMRAGRRPEKEDLQWLNVYNTFKGKSRNRTEIEDLIEEETKEDINNSFLTETSNIIDKTETRIQKIHDHYLKIIADKDKRIDDIIAKQSEQKSKDFAEMVKLVASASKEGAANANQHLATALTTTNSLNSTLMSSLNNQYKHIEEMDRRRREEIVKYLDQKEKDEPGFFDMLMEHIVMPNKDNIEKGISRLAEPLLTQQQK